MPPTDSGSEGENGEKPVRERLKQTTIDKATTDGTQADTEMSTTGPNSVEAAAESSDETPRKRPGRKRSLEDGGTVDTNQDTTEGEPVTPSSGGHLRKKYREIQEEGEADKGNQPLDGHVSKTTGVSRSIEMRACSPDPRLADSTPLSPTRKRSRDNMDAEDREQKIPATEETRARRSSEEERPKLPVEDKAEAPETKSSENGHMVAPQTLPKPSKESSSTTIPPGSAFGNTSSVSGFGTLSRSKSPTNNAASTEAAPPTSESAFKASGFAAMSGATSAFGSLASSSSTTSPSSSSKSPPLSSFASLSSTSTSGFGSIGSKPLGGGTSSFSTFSGGFGGGSIGGFGGGAKLNSFAAPIADTKLGKESEAKPFGAAESGDEDSGSDDDGEDGDGSTPAPNDDASETKFKVQENRDTGEEGEDTIYTHNAKLFHFDQDSKQWKERGVGPIKVNVPQEDPDPDEETAEAPQSPKEGKPEQSKKVPRLLMRQVQTHKLILNAPIFKELKLKENGNKTAPFTVPSDGGKLDLYTLRMGKDSDLKAFCKAVQDLQGKL